MSNVIMFENVFRTAVDVYFRQVTAHTSVIGHHKCIPEEILCVAEGLYPGADMSDSYYEYILVLILN